MKQRFLLGAIIGCLVLCLTALDLPGQAVPPEYSLDDYPPGFGSAECEWGQPNTACMAGFCGPSPSLALFGFFDSDVLLPGPALLISFPPPPEYMDAFSCDHSSMLPCGGGLFVRFSVDRATGGVNAGDASFLQAQILEQAGDIFRSNQPFTHPNDPASPIIPLPPPLPPFPPVYGGPIGPAGIGGFNQLMYDQWGSFGLIPPPPGPPIDNIDGFNEWPHSILASTNPNNFFCLHPASAAVFGVSPADIFICPNPPGLGIPPSVVFVPANMMGLDILVPNPKYPYIEHDSIDGLAFWDNGEQGVLEPGVDWCVFTLAPDSPTLTNLNNIQFPGIVSAADIFITDFQGYFYTWLYPTDIGVGPNPSPPLPPNCISRINVDAVDLTIDPVPVPYINPITTPITGPGSKK